MSEQTPNSYLTLGKVGAAYGVKGWVKIFSFADPAENILNYQRLILADGSNLQTIEIDHSRAQGKGFVAHIKGCDDREQTRLYTGKELLIEKASLPELETQVYYWHQLEGLKVVTLSGANLGDVHHLLETGANDVLVVRASADSVDDEERLIPYLTGRVIDSVDIDQGLIRVDWEIDY